MATTTRRRIGRAGTTTGRGRFARPATPSARPRSANVALRRRRQPEPSGLKKAMGALAPTGATAAARKATPSSKRGKAGGMAMLAAAAGMAYKNRDKLTGMLRKRDSASESRPPSTPAV